MTSCHTIGIGSITQSKKQAHMKNIVLFLLLLLSSLMTISNNSYAQGETNADSIPILPNAILAQILENEQMAWQKVANTTTSNTKDSTTVIYGHINNLLRTDEQSLIYQKGKVVQKFRFDINEESELNYFQIKASDQSRFDEFIQSNFRLLNYAFTSPDKDYKELAKDKMELPANPSSWNPNRIVAQMGITFDQEMTSNWDDYRNNKFDLRTFIANLLIGQVKKHHGKWCYIDNGRFQVIPKKFNASSAAPAISTTTENTSQEAVKTPVDTTQSTATGNDALEKAANTEKTIEWLPFLLGLGALTLLGLIGYFLARLLVMRSSKLNKNNEQLTRKLLQYITETSNPLANKSYQEFSRTIKNNDTLESLAQVRETHQTNQVENIATDFLQFIQEPKGRLKNQYDENTRKQVDQIKAAWNAQQAHKATKDHRSTGHLIQKVDTKDLQKAIAQNDKAYDLLEALKGLFPSENQAVKLKLENLQKRLILSRAVRDQVRELLLPQYQKRYPDIFIQLINKLKRQNDIDTIKKLLAIFGIPFPKLNQNKQEHPTLSLLQKFKENTQKQDLPTTVQTIAALDCMGSLTDNDYSTAIQSLVDKELFFQAIQKALDGAENIEEVKQHITSHAQHLTGAVPPENVMDSYLLPAKKILNNQQMQAYMRNYLSQYKDFYSGTEAINYPVNATDQNWFYTQLFESTIHFHDFMQVSIEGMKNVSKFAYLNYEMILQGKSRTDFPAGSYAKYEEYNAHQAVRTIVDFAKQSGVQALEGVFVRGYYVGEIT